MLTNDHDKTRVYSPQQAAADRSDATELMPQPPTGRNSRIVRTGIILAALSLLIGGFLILSALLSGGESTDTLTDGEETVEAGTEAVVEDGQPAESADDTPTAPAEPADDQADTSDDSAGAADGEAAGTETGAATAAEEAPPVENSLDGAEVPAELAPVVTTIEASIQQLEPAVGTVHVSQEVIDFLRTQEPIDPQGIIVDTCTADYCWVWLHGDSLETRVSVVRDGGAMLLMSIG